MSNDQQHRDWERKAWLAGFLLVSTIILLVIAHMNGCSVQPRKKIVLAPPPTTEPQTCGDLAVGDTREDQCDAGQVGSRVMVCTAAGLKQAATTCHVEGTPAPCGADKTTFAAVQPILARNCSSCHATYATFDQAKGKAAEFKRRTDLPRAEAQHMPKGGDLTAPEKAAVAAWIADGLCPAPTGGEPPSVQETFDRLEQVITDDLLGKVAANRRKTTRYITAPSADIADRAIYKASGQKALNSVSIDRNIRLFVDAAPGVWRFDLEDVRLDAAQWALVEAADVVDIESFTSRGVVLKALTGTRKPWLDADAFGDAALRNSTVYYALTHTPSTFNALAEKVGAQYAADLANFEATLAAFVGSPLSPHNRMVSRHRANDGGLNVTYDTGALDSREKNFFEFPCLGDIGCQKNAQFVAGEVIYSLPNRLHGYALFNAQQLFARGKFVRSDLDKRIDVADVAVVRDFLNPISAEIRSGISCFRCHSGGLLPFRDQVRDHVLANGSEFGRDKDFILAIYKGNAAVSQGLADDNALYATALTQLGVDPAQPDPVTVAADRYLTEWDLAKVARRLRLAPEDFRVLVNQSAGARAQVGQLLSGGTITFDQFVQSLPVLKDELRLFKDPIAN